MVQWAGGAGRCDCQRTAVALPVAGGGTGQGVPLDLRELQRLPEVASRAGQRRVHVGLELLPGARCFVMV